MLANVFWLTPQPKQTVLAKHTIPLEDRYPDKWVNNVFKDNILLTVAYMDGKKSLSSVKKPFSYEFTLKPKETFAFHDDVLNQYQGKVSKTTNAHFNYSEGFESDGYLFGDGVCHLASLIYWTAKDAKVDALAPTNHDFHAIPDIPKEYGVAIYNNPESHGVNSQQNLYITNTNQKPLTFRFDYDGKSLSLTVFANS